jgi:hypothetical protein
MSETMDATGRCLCGAVTVSATAVPTSVGACHCSMCRTWTGGPLMVIDCGDRVRFEGAEHIATYASSDWAERGFCRRCGTHLFYRLKHNRQHFIPAGLLQASAPLHFDHEVFVDEKPAYYRFAGHTHQLTGAQVMARFAGPD